MEKATKFRPNNRFFSIANQLRYGLVSVVVSSVVVTGGVLTYLGFQQQLEQTRLHQQERAQAAANQVSAYLDSLQRQLNYLSDLQGLTDFDVETQRSLLDGLVNSNHAYEIVGIMNNQGRVVQAMSPYQAISPSSLLFTQFSVNSTLFSQPFNERQNYISPVEIDREIDLPVTWIAVPIRNRENQINGVLFAKINLNFLSQIVSRTEVGKTGYTYVLDDRLVLIAKKGSTPNAFELQDLKNRPFVQNLSQLSRSLNTKPFFIYQGLNGEDVFGTATLVRRVQWTVVVELPTAEVYAPVRKMIIVMGAALLVITLVAVSLGVAFSRSIVVPLQRLTTTAAQLRDGYLDSRVEIPSRNELGDLGKSFNSMAEQLQQSFATLEANNAEMKLLNQALAESESRLAQFLDAMPVGVFVTEANGKPYYTNQIGKQILGQGLVESVTVEELRETYQVYLAGTEQVYPRECDPIANALQGKSVTVDDMEICQLNKIIPIESSGTPIYDELGNIAYAISAFTDITERKQAEKLIAEYSRTLEIQVAERTQELKNALDHLKATQEELIQSEKMAALGQLVAGVAHEINTPLGAIRSSIGNIDDFLTNNLEKLPEFFQNLSQERQQDFLALLSQSSQKSAPLSTKEKRQLKRELKCQLEAQAIENADSLASTLVNIGVQDDIQPFLALLKDPNGETILKTAYELASIQKSTRTITTATERAAKVVFALKSYAHYDHSGEKVRANITEGIETVLTLYYNQIKQGVEVVKNYGEVSPILCYPDELNQVWTNLVHNALQAMDYKGILRIDVTRQSSSILVSITDSGKGIPLEIMGKIFEPFFTTKPAGEGSGLGLDIVKKIVEKHQGKIEVSSVPGQTSFTVSLPINPNEETSPI